MTKFIEFPEENISSFLKKPHSSYVPRISLENRIEHVTSMSPFYLVLKGPPGIGKTMLLQEWVSRNKLPVIALDFSSEDTLNRSISILEVGGIFLRDRLSWKEGWRYLDDTFLSKNRMTMLWDHVDDERFLKTFPWPSYLGGLIITTRLSFQLPAPFYELSVPPFSVSETKMLIHDILGSNESERDVDSFITLLKGVPRDMVQVLAFIKANQIDLNTYLNDFDSKSISTIL